jgi:Arc/MetJ-type ribon-helix-helix transcriptional regulator
MVRTQIQLTEEQVRKIKKVAMAKHQSVAELIRQAVDNILKAGASADMEDRRKRAVNIAGKFSSGKSDISRKHDSYLTEAFKK